MQYFNSSQDFFYTTASSSLTYVLTCDGEFVYTGRCVKSPSAAEMKINVAERVRDWTAQNMPDFRQFDGEVVQHPYAYRVFELRDDLGTLLETYGVLLDWGVPFTGADLIMSDPVNGHVDARQKIFWSSFGLNGRQIPIEFAADLHIVFNPAPPFVFSSDGGVMHISYTATTPFTLSQDGYWFTATAAGGTLSLNAQINGDEQRTGSICFSYFGSDFQTHTVCYSVVQLANTGFTVSPALIEWNYDRKYSDGVLYLTYKNEPGTGGQLQWKDINDPNFAFLFQLMYGQAGYGGVRPRTNSGNTTYDTHIATAVIANDAATSNTVTVIQYGKPHFVGLESSAITSAGTYTFTIEPCGGNYLFRFYTNDNKVWNWISIYDATGGTVYAGTMRIDNFSEPPRFTLVVSPNTTPGSTKVGSLYLQADSAPGKTTTDTISLSIPYTPRT